MPNNDKEMINQLFDIIHNMVVGQQSAWIEWQYGKGAKAGMGWIENGLEGPGNIPCEDMSKYYKDAQLFYNEQKSNPFPVCFCGKPSSTLWMGYGYCSSEHSAMHQKDLEDKSNKIAIDAIEKMKK